MEKNVIESGQVEKRVIEHFFFCNSEQIRLARRFVSHFLLETNATFNISRLNMLLSVLLGITNTETSFLVAYCYITSESKESFMFLFAYIQELIFYDYSPDCYDLIGDFAAGLEVAMVKTVTKREYPVSEAEFAWKMGQVIDHANTDCALQLCTWHVAEAIKKAY